MLCVDIFGDNKGAVATVNNPSSASRSKHIDVKCPFFKDLCACRKDSYPYVRNEGSIRGYSHEGTMA